MDVVSTFLFADSCCVLVLLRPLWDPMIMLGFSLCGRRGGQRSASSSMLAGRIVCSVRHLLSPCSLPKASRHDTLDVIWVITMKLLATWTSRCQWEMCKSRFNVSRSMRVTEGISLTLPLCVLVRSYFALRSVMGWRLVKMTWFTSVAHPFPWATAGASFSANTPWNAASYEQASFAEAKSCKTEGSQFCCRCGSVLAHGLDCTFATLPQMGRSTNICTNSDSWQGIQSFEGMQRALPCTKRPRSQIKRMFELTRREMRTRVTKLPSCGVCMSLVRPWKLW